MNVKNNTMFYSRFGSSSEEYPSVSELMIATEMAQRVLLVNELLKQWKNLAL